MRHGHRHHRPQAARGSADGLGARRLPVGRRGAPSAARAVPRDDPERRGGVRRSARAAGSAAADDARVLHGRPGARELQLRRARHALRDRGGQGVPAVSIRAPRTLPAQRGLPQARVRELRGPPADRREWTVRRADRRRFAPPPRPSGLRRIGASHLRRARHRRTRARRCAPGAAGFRSQLPRDLRGVRGRHPGARLGHWRDPGRESARVRGLRLHARGARRPAAAGTRCLGGNDAGVGRRACCRDREARRHRHVRVATAAQGWQPALGRRAAQGCHDRRATPDPGDHARHHRTQTGRRGAARERGAVPRRVQRLDRCAGAVELPLGARRRQPGLRAHVRLRALRGADGGTRPGTAGGLPPAAGEHHRQHARRRLVPR